MNLNYIAYPGNKTRFIPVILEYIRPFINDDSVFVELFGGSGTLSLNLSQESIKQVIFYELDKQIFKMHYSFKHGNYDQLQFVLNEIWNYGDPKNIKEDYYNARTALNAKYFNVDSIESGFYNWAISTFAINSMVRFGPNGFNQGWGNRGEGLTQSTQNMTLAKFNKIKEAYGHIELHNETYLKFFDKEISEKQILFLDPPYTDKGSGTYSFSKDQHVEVINKIKSLTIPIIYTDVYSSDILASLGPGWYNIILRDNMGSGKPGLNSENIEKEAMYVNFKIPTSKSLF